MAYLEELFVQNLRYFTEREILIRNEPEKRNNFTLFYQKRRNFSLSTKLESSSIAFLWIGFHTVTQTMERELFSREGGLRSRAKQGGESRSFGGEARGREFKLV